jgi:hypothetical protein
MQLPTKRIRHLVLSARAYQHWPPTDTRADHSIGPRCVDTPWTSPSQIPSWTKKRMQATSVADTGIQPAPTYPSSLHTHAHLKLNLPCTASTCILLCHQAICSKPQIFKDLSHLLSSGAASRFQNAPRCSGSRCGWLQTEPVVTSDSRLTASSCARARTCIAQLR